MGSHWVWFLVVVAIAEDAVQSAEFRRMAMDSQRYFSMAVRNKDQCHQLCVSQTLCASFNYDVRERICQLFTQSSVSGGSLVHRPHSVYVHVPRDVSSRRSGSCSQRKCKKLDVCVSTGHVQHVCLSAVVDCGDPSNSPNTLVKYNSTVFGSVALVECLEGYHSNSTSSVCQASGTWSDFSQCLRPTCASPPLLPNGNVVYRSLLVGSVANYTCHSDYQFVGLSPSSTCNLTGSWNGLSGSCERFAFHNLTLPFSEPIPGIVHSGWKVEILGTPTSLQTMVFELGYSGYIALNVGVRFRQGASINVVVLNSRDQNGWGQERRPPSFPFVVGMHFNVTILVNHFFFQIHVDESQFALWMNNVNIALINKVNIRLACQIDSVKMFN
ncbi:uncharacterized protein LOC121386759 [Gigantopelta aegis]|uniref:uncharacterized protein LOC121386759 n=1 Tax=Gigantopelta aegis TaxID=1735272 RepID=UPI001B8884CE|nr:uncharacterized protein LOC121386759 [Gigantopelta aegis]